MCFRRYSDTRNTRKMKRKHDMNSGSTSGPPNRSSTPHSAKTTITNLGIPSASLTSGNGELVSQTGGACTRALQCDMTAGGHGEAGVMTDMDLLGPCEPGTSVVLEGIVWTESNNGILVVNVTWRGKTYVGTLMDATKHHWAPPRYREDSPVMDLDWKAPKYRNGRSTNNSNHGHGANSSNSNNNNNNISYNNHNNSSCNNSNNHNNSHSNTDSPVTEGRRLRKCRRNQNSNNNNNNGNNSGHNNNNNNNSNSTVSSLRSQASRQSPVFGSDATPGSGSSRRRPRTATDHQQLLQQQQQLPQGDDGPVPPKRSRDSPHMWECEEGSCGKKFKHVTGLKYHKTHAHRKLPSLPATSVAPGDEPKDVSAATASAGAVAVAAAAAATATVASQDGGSGGAGSSRKPKKANRNGTPVQVKSESSSPVAEIVNAFGAGGASNIGRHGSSSSNSSGSHGNSISSSSSSSSSSAQLQGKQEAKATPKSASPVQDRKTGPTASEASSGAAHSQNASNTNTATSSSNSNLHIQSDEVSRPAKKAKTETQQFADGNDEDDVKSDDVAKMNSSESRSVHSSSTESRIDLASSPLDQQQQQQRRRQTGDEDDDEEEDCKPVNFARFSSSLSVSLSAPLSCSSSVAPSLAESSKSPVSLASSSRPPSSIVVVVQESPLNCKTETQVSEQYPVKTEPLPLLRHQQQQQQQQQHQQQQSKETCVKQEPAHLSDRYHQGYYGAKEPLVWRDRIPPPPLVPQPVPHSSPLYAGFGIDPLYHVQLMSTSPEYRGQFERWLAEQHLRQMFSGRFDAERHSSALEAKPVDMTLKSSSSSSSSSGSFSGHGQQSQQAHDSSSRSARRPEAQSTSKKTSGSGVSSASSAAGISYNSSYSGGSVTGDKKAHSGKKPPQPTPPSTPQQRLSGAFVKEEVQRQRDEQFQGQASHRGTPRSVHKDSDGVGLFQPGFGAFPHHHHPLSKLPFDLSPSLHGPAYLDPAAANQRAPPHHFLDRIASSDSSIKSENPSKDGGKTPGGKRSAESADDSHKESSMKDKSVPSASPLGGHNSPLTLRHLHTHHHTHVLGPAYSLYGSYNGLVPPVPPGLVSPVVPVIPPSFIPK